MIVATPVTADGQSTPSWGRAHWVGVAEVDDGQVTGWQIYEVGWDESHDASTHGSHHARIVRFLTEHAIEAVVVDHVGPGMAQVLTKMGIPVLPASPGYAPASILAALAELPAQG